MDGSSEQLQKMATHSPLESVLVGSKANSQQQRKARPQPEQALNCPRCDSTNTKFCYYNNYSLSQPRYFCKSCRRYWTKGGTLRSVPVGGGCRKNKRSSSSSTSSTSSLSSKRTQDHQPLMISNNPLTSLPHLMSYDTSNELTLAFARLQQKQNSRSQLGFDHDHDHGRDSSVLGNPNACDTLGNPSNNFLDALRNGFLDTYSNFHNSYYGYGNESNVGNQADQDHHDHDHHGGSEEMVEPFGDHRQMSSSTTTDATTTTAVTVTTTKQESENRDKGLWGFPWQLHSNPDHAISIINNHDLNSNWHGLINSPLM